MYAIDRKYLIRTPLKWPAKFLFHRAVRTKIEQTHINLAGVPSRIHRYEYCDVGRSSKSSFYQSSKLTPYNSLTEALYYNLLGYRDTDRNVVAYDRYSFHYNYAQYTCDLYDRELSGLCTLSFLDYDDNQPHIPPFLDVIKDITDEALYSPDNLSTASYFDDLD